MKIRAAIGIVMGILVLGLLFIGRPPEQVVPAQMTLSSDPYPLTLGMTMLLVSLTDAAGAPLEDAVVEITTTMKHDAMLPLTRRASPSQNGVYRIPMEWPMMGQWVVDVRAALADGGMLRDQFEVFIYATPPTGNIRSSTYQSLSQTNAVSSDPRELRFVIPQGTQALILSGHGEDVVPKEIRLNLSGQNVLVIHNDDIVDHTIGPFFIKSGETIRQQFTGVATYVGACSVRFSDQVSIIIED
jgi:hypothetical protein